MILDKIKVKLHSNINFKMAVLGIIGALLPIIFALAFLPE